MLLVSLMLPMGIPPELCIEGREDEAGYGDTISVISEHSSRPWTHTTRSPLFQKPALVMCKETEDILQAKLAPQLSALGSMLVHARTLAVELIVLGACELLRLGAVVATGLAEGGTDAEGLAQRGAGDNARGVHGGGIVFVGQLGVCRGWRGDGSEGKLD